MEINVYSDSGTQQKKLGRGRSSGNCQEIFQIPYDKNEANKSMVVRKTVYTSKTIEHIARETIEPNASNKFKQIVSEQKEIARNQIAYHPHFTAYLDNIPTPSLTTPLGKIIARNWMTRTEQSAQILWPATEIGAYINNANPLRSDTANWMDPTIQPTIFHFKKAT